MTNDDRTPAIELVNVSKIYRTYPTPRHRLLEIISGGRKSYSRETHALDDITYSLEKGGKLGIVGENGSGKSTLLKALAGVLTPTKGTINVHGRVSALLELGAGFNQELNGTENINQFCMLHGMNSDEIDDALPEIISFSELRDAVNHPVKTYSSGMAVRLGFACAVYVQPDILIVDEALSVGDAYFQNKCLHKIRAMLDGGTTFIYVTHAPDAIRSLCTEGIWLEHGRIRLQGASADVGSAYQSEIFRKMIRSDLVADPDVSQESDNNQEPSETHKIHATDNLRQKSFAERVAPLRTGSGEVRIVDIELLDASGNETDTLPFESDAHVRVYFNTLKPTEENVSVNFGIFDTSGVQLMHFNSLSHGFDTAALTPNKSYAVDFKFKCPLIPGEYGLTAGIAEMIKSPTMNARMITGNVVDYCVGGARFSVQPPDESDHRDLWGVCYTDYEVDLTPIS